MAIEESELPNGTVGTPTSETRDTDAGSPSLTDDFRLRLDSPLFHRDTGLGASAVQVPRLRELTWEHVVRPTTQRDVSPHDTASAEEAADMAVQMAHLLAGLKQVPAAVEPSFVEPLLVVEAPVVEAALVDEALQVETPSYDEAPVRYDSLPPLKLLLPSVTESVVADEPLDRDDPVGVGSAPASAESPIETLLAALKHMDDVEQQYIPAPREPAAERQPRPEQGVSVESPREPLVEAQSESVPERSAVTQSPVPLAGLDRIPTGAASAVEAELNRLAYLPDREDEPGPVRVPPIARTEQPPAPAPAPVPAPALSQHEMYSPRQPVPVVHARSIFSELAASAYVPPRKRKRGLVRRILTFVVLLGMIGGGLFAARYYLLDPQWKGEMKAVAESVEGARGLQFDHAVTVTSLPVDEYAVELATVSLGLGLGDGSLEAAAGEWRALGLLTGEIDLRAIGLAALPDSPAFYDPSSETIFVADEVPAELARFGLHRALTLALLDQEYGWGDRVAGASGSVAHGTRALYDADALATAVGMTSDAARSEIMMQIFGVYATLEIPLSPSPYATAATGRLGLALQPFVEATPAAERDVFLADALITDGQVLDLRRFVSGAEEMTAATSRGMLFWYHVLASRLDANTAWVTALAWQGDVVSTVAGINGVCVVANIIVDPAAIDATTRAFQQWAANGPAGAQASITAATVGDAAQLTVNSCDPGAAVPTNDGRPRLSLGGAPLRAEQYRQLFAAQPTLPAAQLACAVYGADGVSMTDERGVIDPVSGWPAAAAHPAPDPIRLGCTG